MPTFDVYPVFGRAGSLVRFGGSGTYTVHDVDTGVLLPVTQPGGSASSTVIVDTDGRLQFETVAALSVVITDARARGISTTVYATIGGGGGGGATDESVAVQIDAGAATQAAGDARWQRNLGMVSPESFGAVGDGTTDDTADVQAALDAAGVGGTVWLRRGRTYALDTPGALDYMLKVYPGQTITGGGTLKVKSGAGNYRSVLAGASGSTDLSGLTLDGITIDQNNTGNALASTSSLFAGFPRFAVFVGAGTGITVRNCTFRDIDSVNTVVLNGAALADVRITGCTFSQVGTSVTAHDHSTVYISASGMHVSGNTFLGVAGGLGATTAIETHGSGQNVTDNTIRDFYTGANITGVAAAGSDAAVVTGNVMRDVNIGIQLWSRTPGNGLRYCTVSRNVITIKHDNWVRGTTDYPCGILFEPTATADFSSITITDNIIEYQAVTVAPQVSEHNAAGIMAYVVSTAVVLRDMVIARNQIRGSLSAGIRLQATSERVTIERNEIVNPGSSSEAAFPTFYDSGITITGTLTDVRVIGNRTIDTKATHTLAQGIQMSVTAVTRGVARDNAAVCYDGAQVPPIRQTAGKWLEGRAEQPVGTRFTPNLYYGPQGNRGTVAAVNNTLTMAPFWVSEVTKFDRIGAQVTVAGAASTVIRLGIYADDGRGTPGALVLDAGTIAGDAVAAAEITISTTLEPGLYWLGAVPQGGSPTVTCLSGDNIIGAGTTLAVATSATPRPGYVSTGITGALPAAFVSTGQTPAAILAVLRASV